MANTVAVRVDTTQITRALETLGKRAPVAVMRGLNRTGGTGRTVLARAVAKDMGIAVSTAREAIRVDKATRGNLAVRVVARGKRLPLIEFKARGPQPSKGRGSGVSYVTRGGQRARIQRAFISSVSRSGEDGQHAGHRGVFVRTGRARLPIKQLYGASIAHSFGNLAPALQGSIGDTLEQNVAKEIDFELSRLKAST